MALVVKKVIRGLNVLGPSCRDALKDLQILTTAALYALSVLYAVKLGKTGLWISMPTPKETGTSKCLMHTTSASFKRNLTAGVLHSKTNC